MNHITPCCYVSLPETEILTQLRQETAQHPMGKMQIAPEQGQFTALLVHRPGGLIAIDNVLWSGRVADPQVQDNRTNKIRAFNHKLHPFHSPFLLVDGVAVLLADEFFLIR